MKITTDNNGSAEFFRALEEGAARATERAATVYVGEMKGRFNTLGRFVRSPPGQPPNVQTGDLRRSVGFNRYAPMRAHVGTASVVGKWMEKGIVSRGKMMTVPLNREAEKLRLYNRSLKSVAGLFVVSLKSDLFLCRSRGHRGAGGLEFLFRLTRVILPRPWVRPVMNDRSVAVRARDVAAAELRRAVSVASKGGAR